MEEEELLPLLIVTPAAAALVCESTVQGVWIKMWQKFNVRESFN